LMLIDIKAINRSPRSAMKGVEATTKGYKKDPLGDSVTYGRNWREVNLTKMLRWGVRKVNGENQNPVKKRKL